MAEPPKIKLGPLEKQSKQVIFNLYEYFKAEVPKDKSPITTAIKLVSKSIGISVRSVQKLIAESKQSIGENGPQFTGPKTKKPRICPTAIGAPDRNKIKGIIKNFHLENSRFPTIKQIHEKLKEDKNYKGGISTLRKRMISHGFKWKKSQGNLTILMENHDVKDHKISMERHDIKDHKIFMERHDVKEHKNEMDIVQIKVEVCETGVN